MTSELFGNLIIDIA